MQKFNWSMSEKKNLQIKQFLLNCDSYNKIIILNCERVGALQLLKFRKSLRESVVLNGNKKVFKKAIEMNKSKYPELQKLIPFLNHQVCVLFSNEKKENILKYLDLNTEWRFAEEGEVLQEDVYILPQHTMLEPSQTFGFSSLNIATKITKGQIEIINETVIPVTGKKLTNFMANFFRNLGIKTIKSSLKVLCFFEDGEIYPPNVLELTQEILNELMRESIENIACISLGANYTNITTIQSEIINALSDILSVSIETSFEINETNLIVDYLRNPKSFEREIHQQHESSTEEDSDLNIHPFNPWDDLF
jgi:large subunit ribosomal protein LP0